MCAGTTLGPDTNHSSASLSQTVDPTTRTFWIWTYDVILMVTSILLSNDYALTVRRGSTPGTTYLTLVELLRHAIVGTNRRLDSLLGDRRLTELLAMSPDDSSRGTHASTRRWAAS